MTDETTSAATEQVQQTEQTPEFAPITSQEALDKVIGERLARERSKFADYADLKAKASQLDQLEEAKKSEIEKVSEKLAAAEREKAELLTSVAKANLRAELSTLGEHAAAFVDDLDISRYVDEAGQLKADSLAALKERLGAFNAPRSPRPDPSQASGSKSGLAGGTPLTPAEQFVSFIQGQLPQ